MNIAVNNNRETDLLSRCYQIEDALAHCVGYKAKIRGGESLEIGEILQEKITCLPISVPQ